MYLAIRARDALPSGAIDPPICTPKPECGQERMSSIRSRPKRSPLTGEVRIRKILFPVDPSADSLKPLDLLRLIAGRHKAEVILFHAVHVDTPPIYYTAGIDSVLKLDPDLHRRMEKRMRDLAGADLAGLVVRYVVMDGRAVALTKDFAVRERVDLIVMASAGSHGIGELLFGGTASRVVQKAVCPVLVA